MNGRNDDPFLTGTGSSFFDTSKSGKFWQSGINLKRISYGHKN